MTSRTVGIRRGYASTKKHKTPKHIVPSVLFYPSLSSDIVSLPQLLQVLGGELLEYRIELGNHVFVNSHHL